MQSEKQAAEATVDDHLRRLIQLMKRGGRVSVTDIPNDPTFLSSHFGGETSRAMADRLESALSAAEPEPSVATNVTAEALEQFTAYFVKNYPGPNTIIFDPKWHAPKIFRAAVSALSAQVQDIPEKVGRFGHHPEPAIDFCIEVEALEGHLFDAKHGIGKPGHEPRRIDDEFRRRVSSAMDFIVGGDQIAIAAKATLRSISAQVQDVAGWQPIETAPTDGSPLLLRLSNGEIFSGWGAFETDGSKTWRRFHATSADVGWLNARHWMPVPAAPAKQEGGTNE